MASFKVTGGRQMKGEIIPQGAKKRSTANLVCGRSDQRTRNNPQHSEYS